MLKNVLRIPLALLLLVPILCLLLLLPSLQRYVLRDQEAYEALQQTDRVLYRRLGEDALRLGLDLQGGLHLSMRVHAGEAVAATLEQLAVSVQDVLGREQIPFLDVRRVERHLELAFQPEHLERARGRLHELLGARFELGTRSEEARALLVADVRPALRRSIEEDAFQQVLETLRKRVEDLGIAEPSIQRQGTQGRRLLVQIPGLEDPEQAKRVVTTPGELQFRIARSRADTHQALASRFPGGCPDRDPDDRKEIYTCPDGTLLLPGDVPALAGQVRPGYYHVAAEVLASSGDLEGAGVSSDLYGRPAVAYTVKPASSERFGRLTRENLGKQMAVVLDGRVKSASTLQASITRNGLIAASFTPREAYELALLLRSGALPVRVEVIEERRVGASLGNDSVRYGRDSFLAGTALVALFLVLYYRIGGLVAVATLAYGTLMALAALAAFGAMLTLPGIAGLVLTVGLAVDTVIVLLERIRSELDLGKTMASAVAAGFQKALAVLADSNVTTLLVAFVLLGFGVGPVRDFGGTLAVGILASLAAMLLVPRTLFSLVLSAMPLYRLRFRRKSPSLHLDLKPWRMKALAVSAAIIALGLVSMAGHRLAGGRALSWGPELVGGAMVQVRFAESVDISEARRALRRAGHTPAIQLVRGRHELLLRTSQPESATALIEALGRHFEPGNPIVEHRVDSIGPQIGRRLQETAILTLLTALVCVLLYLSVRFDLYYALGAIAAALHDALLVLAVFAILRLEVDRTFVAALMATVGYSLNDALVVFHRIRENAALRRHEDFGALVALSLDETLARTLLTSLAALLTALALLLLGGPALRSAAVALFVGVLAGTVSTVSVATPLLERWKARGARGE
jgi:SecD/SecF fusion protein